MKQNDISCKFNNGVACDPEKANCGKCGWNPKVDRERKRRFSLRLLGRREESQTVSKTVSGLAATMQGAKPVQLVLSLSRNKNGEFVSLEYTAAGMALAIPLDCVLEMRIPDGGQAHE